ncbi:Hypothetical_protein [Hexamita inflata]|uniref:Hypothetical_protein n=1 Tax=Hexamita inflata TaxID=28002 RepID=A0AA86UV16_9EUKA|nr:Hypothetical protein HINF_LOCUS53371 [Hexamita inflata]
MELFMDVHLKCGRSTATLQFDAVFGSRPNTAKKAVKPYQMSRLIQKQKYEICVFSVRILMSMKILSLKSYWLYFGEGQIIFKLPSLSQFAKKEEYMDNQ